MKPVFCKKNRGLVIIILMLVLSMAVSVFLGGDVIKSCFYAIILSITAGGASMALMAIKSSKSAVLNPVIILALGFLRLLIMLAGSITILFFVPVSFFWFLIWTGLFYICFLTWEICWIVKLSKGKNEGVQF